MTPQERLRKVVEEMEQTKIRSLQTELSPLLVIDWAVELREVLKSMEEADHAEG